MYFVILITVYLPKLKFKVSRMNFYVRQWVYTHTMQYFRHIIAAATAAGGQIKI